jgi:hypothetical protein
METENGWCLFQSLATLLGNNERQCAAMRLKTVLYIYNDWRKFWPYVAQYTKDEYKGIRSGDAAVFLLEPVFCHKQLHAALTKTRSENRVPTKIVCNEICR